jgi:hypothetical protein
MAKPAPLYAGFLGTWILDPTTCDYQQGEPPQAGSYRIEEDGEQLVLTMQWIDADDVNHEVAFTGIPNGEQVPFAGGDLADALSITAVSARELNSSAYWKGTERMLAQRQLDETGAAMRVTQVVFFPEGFHLANVAIYRKRVLN